MSVRKILLLTAAIIAAIICLGFIGIRLMTTAIYQSNSCEWANIDNIELHTLADIPAITDSRCRVDTVSNTKYATFQIDLKKVELDKYIVNNNLIKIGDAEAKKRELVALHNLQAESVTADLYERHGQYKDEKYSLLLDAGTGKLSVNIKYGK